MKICAIDVETQGPNREWVSGALWSDETTLYATSRSEFVSALRSHARKRYTFFAHNAEFDGTAVLWESGEDFRIHYVNDVYDCGYWKYGESDRNAQLWDTVRLTAGMSLAMLGDAIGLPKYPTPKTLLGEDDWRQSWVCDEHSQRECVECYNLRDAEIVWAYMNALRDWTEGNLITLRRSLPGIAMELWKTWDAGNQQTLAGSETIELSRAAHHGGRCEVFKYGVVPWIKTHDIRSHYGWLLATMELPDCTTLTYRRGPLDFDNIADALGVVEATVDVAQQHIPPLPAVYDSHVYFPVGRFKGQWSIAELANAVEHGVTVARVHRATWTHKAFRPFNITASALLNSREDALARDDSRQLIFKLLINSIVGRLAMRDAQVRRIYRRWRPGLTPDELRGYELESSANAVYACKEVGQTVHSKTSNVMWAALITAAGRIKLYDHLLQAGASLAYCDTDSVHCTTTIPTGPNMPGQLVPKGEYQRGIYVGPKLYHLSDDDGRSETRAKGIPRSAAEQYINDGHTTFQRSLSVREAIERGLPAGTWIDTSRELGYGIGARTVHDFAAVTNRDGYSPTSPVVLLPSDTGGLTLNVRDSTSA